MKTCRKCGEEKGITAFGVNNSKTDGLNCYCKICVREINKKSKKANPERVKAEKNAWVKKSREAHPEQWAKYARTSNAKPYNITAEQFNALLKGQNNLCAICVSTFKKTPHIDHCHATGKVRGLLCYKCNIGIGLLGDNADICEAAAYYLRLS